MSSPKPRGLGFVVEATRFVGFVGGAERVANPATGGPARFALRLGSIDSGVVRGHRPVVRRPIAPHPPERKNQPEGNRAAMRTPSRSEIERENRGSATRSLTPGGSPSSFARFRVPPDSGCQATGSRVPLAALRLACGAEVSWGSVKQHTGVHAEFCLRARRGILALARPRTLDLAGFGRNHDLIISPSMSRRRTSWQASTRSS